MLKQFIDIMMWLKSLMHTRCYKTAFSDWMKEGARALGPVYAELFFCERIQPLVHMSPDISLWHWHFVKPGLRVGLCRNNPRGDEKYSAGMKAHMHKTHGCEICLTSAGKKKWRIALCCFCYLIFSVYINSDMEYITWALGSSDTETLFAFNAGTEPWGQEEHAKITASRWSSAFWTWSFFPQTTSENTVNFQTAVRCLVAY